MTRDWLEIEKPEYTALWDRFDAMYSFRPSVSPEKWPGIVEPAPSITYSIVNDPIDPDYDLLGPDLNECILRAFRKARPDDRWLFALDWQHDCYRVDLHSKTLADNGKDWPIPVLPDGDYYIFLSEDMASGTFGHPWEQTICVFGRELLLALRDCMPKLLSRPIRRRTEPDDAL